MSFNSNCRILAAELNYRFTEMSHQPVGEKCHTIQPGQSRRPDFYKYIYRLTAQKILFKIYRVKSFKTEVSMSAVTLECGQEKQCC